MTLPIAEARNNDEVISLASSQVLRWLDELNGITDADAKAREIRAEINRIRKEPNSRESKAEIRRLYAQMDSIQFKPDYMCLIIDKEKDYYRACKGFSINGISYKRLLGTNGGIKNSTIVFISERHADEIRRRIDNGRDMNKELVPAKLEAYKALTCSASIPVSMPNGILVVSDVETEYTADTIYLNDECEGEPEMEYRPGSVVRMDASDGFGLMMPSLAERWSRELNLDYTVSGVNTRFSFEKGMVFTFDFQAFARDVAENYIVHDVWGNEVDIRDVELILTESMLKLWDSYPSCDALLECCRENGYTFGVTKTCPEFLENERTLNYQFIQSYDLDNEDIDRLIAPTMNELREVLGNDWRKSLLFLFGSELNAEKVRNLPKMNCCKSVMADRRMINDPFIFNHIYQLIRKRIDEAKVGVLKVHGNYSIVCGDPYALCQHIFGLEVTGLLKAGEIYNQYWADAGAEKLSCYRAPMTCHNNIRLVHPVDNAAVRYWYQYIHTGTVFNAWDTATAALNGCDFDGDMVMLTDNEVLVNKLEVLPALMCVQRKAAKRVPTEADTIRSNIESFGNDIGKTTNWITSMFEVRSHYDRNSDEYKELSYRIKCGQLYQQNVIDKAKGIIAKPMPREWHDRRSVNLMEDEEKKRFYRSIVADRKPYFMRYIYPDLMKQYNTYIKNTDKNAIREMQLSVRELESMPVSELSDRQKEFLRYYDSRMPVGTGDCVMNRICRKFEKEFDGFVGRQTAQTKFDYTIMKSDAEYTQSQYYAIKKLYDDYNRRIRNYNIQSHYEHIDSDEAFSVYGVMKQQFVNDCRALCPNGKALCNIVLDMCYRKNGTKRFAWEMCGDQIFLNLLENNGGTVSFPVRDENGETEYCGNRFSIETIRLGEEDEYCTE